MSVAQIDRKIEALLNKKNALIKKQNGAFKKLTKNQKRITIAKEVLDLIKIFKVSAKSGYIEGIDTYENENLLLNKDLQEVINEKWFQEDCTVCALGSCVLAKAKIMDNCLADDAIGLQREDAHDELKSFFSEEQMFMIESAFEYELAGQNNLFYGGSPLDPDKTQACIKFGRKYKNDKSRLAAIMQNIIKNKGEFIP